MNKKWYPYLLILPSIIVMVFLYLYPILLTIWQSFNEVSLLTGEMNFVGFANYIEAFKDPSVHTTMLITLKYTLITVIFKLVIGFAFAYLLNSKIYFKKPLRFLQLVPWAIPNVATGTIWKWMLDGNYGYLNYYLMKLGIISQPITWLSNPTYAFYACCFVDAWAGVSAVCTMFLAGLQGIDTSLYEAAEMDGAGKFRQFIDITMPGLKKVFLTTLVLVTIWTFDSYNIIFVLTEGGPMRATETIMIRIYQEAFSRFDIGMSSTLSVIAFIMLMLLTILYIRRLEIDE